MDYEFIPGNLDLEALFAQCPPPEIVGFKFRKDHLLHIVSLISKIPAEKPWVKAKDGYIPVSGRRLRGYIRGYEHYLRYLVQSRVFETDNKYEVKKKCKGYRLTDHYLTKPQIIVPVTTLRKGILFEHPLDQKWESEFGHLDNWFGQKLQIKYDSAMDYIDEELAKAQKEFKKTSDASALRAKLIRYNRSKISIERIHQNKHVFKVGNKIQRFYSTLTSMPKDIRNFLTYEGERLVSIDLKNCQPYLLLVILNRLFWTEETTLKSLHLTDLKNDKIIQHLRRIIGDIKYNSIMVDRFQKVDFDVEVDRYRHVVSTGALYDFLNESVLHWYGELVDISIVKEGLLMGFFADNRVTPRLLIMDLFRDEFPEIHSFIKEIKKFGKDQFAHILQQIESVIFLLKIAKRIHLELADVPFYTVHDNIITTSSNVEKIKKVMEEELTKAVGAKPSFGIQVLSITKDLINEDEKEETEIKSPEKV